MPARAVTNVTVSCTDQPFTLGGTITGLGNNTGLVLVNGGDTLTVAAGRTAFTMPTPVAFGSAYSVTVETGPAGLTCTASNASGTMPASNVTNIVIACSDQSYTVGGTISGLTASGLVLANGSDTLSVSSGASSFMNTNPVQEPMNSLPLYIYTAYTTHEPVAIARGFGAASVLLAMVLALFVVTRLLVRDKGGRR